MAAAAQSTCTNMAPSHERRRLMTENDCMTIERATDSPELDSMTEEMEQRQALLPTQTAVVLSTNNSNIQHHCVSENQIEKCGVSPKPRRYAQKNTKGSSSFSSSAGCTKPSSNKVHLLSPPDPPSPTFSVQSTDSGHSMAGWAKLRTTVKVAGAVKTKKHRKTSGISRQDSFMKRFTTRYQRNSLGSQDSEEESAAGTLLNKQRITTATEGKKPAVVNPDGDFMFYWLAIVTVSVLYNLWTCIAREAFPEIRIGYEIVWFVMDGICDFIYLIDICVQLRTGYLERGLVVYSTSKLAKHYVKSRCFVIDILSLLPLDLLQLFLGPHPLIRFPRFLKAYRAYRFSYIVETRTVYPNMWRVANLSHVLFLGSHWFAAFYYMISEAEDFRGSWGYPKPKGVFASVARKYLKSLYWSTLTLTTIGDLPPPESDKEYVFTIVSYLIGVFVFATIVGQVGNVITNRNASRQEFERLLDGAKAYMRNHNVPIDMQRRVQRWYDYAWSRGRVNGGGDINSLGLLPDKLKTELALHVNLETLKKVTIFQECEPEFLHDLVLKMKAFIFTPGDLICRKGEVAREMFIIADGLLEVIRNNRITCALLSLNAQWLFCIMKYGNSQSLESQSVFNCTKHSDSGEVLTQMGTGDFFGEIGILNLDGGVNRRTADVRSVGYSELFVLSREDVLCALKDHPEAEAVIKKCAQKRLKELNVHNRRKQKEKLSSKQQELSPHDSPTLEKIANTSVTLISRVAQLGKENNSDILVANGPTSLHHTQQQQQQSTKLGIKRYYNPGALIRKILPTRRENLKSSSQSQLDTMARNRAEDVKCELQRRLSKSYGQINTSKDDDKFIGEIQPLITSPSGGNEVTCISPCTNFLHRHSTNFRPAAVVNQFNTVDTHLSSASVGDLSYNNNTNQDLLSQHRNYDGSNPVIIVVNSEDDDNDSNDSSDVSSPEKEQLLSCDQTDLSCVEKTNQKQPLDSLSSSDSNSSQIHSKNCPLNDQNIYQSVPPQLSGDSVHSYESETGDNVRNVQFDNPSYDMTLLIDGDLSNQQREDEASSAQSQNEASSTRFNGASGSGKRSITGAMPNGTPHPSPLCDHPNTEKCRYCLPMGNHCPPNMPNPYCDTQTFDLNQNMQSADRTPPLHRHTFHGVHSNRQCKLPRKTSLPGSLHSYCSIDVIVPEASESEAGCPEDTTDTDDENIEVIQAVQGILQQKIVACRQKYADKIEVLEADNKTKDKQIQQLQTQVQDLKRMLTSIDPPTYRKIQPQIKWPMDQRDPVGTIPSHSRMNNNTNGTTHTGPLRSSADLDDLVPKILLTNEDDMVIEL